MKQLLKYLRDEFIFHKVAKNIKRIDSLDISLLLLFHSAYFEGHRLFDLEICGKK